MSNDERESLRQELLALQKKRDEKEQEILAYQDVLKTQNVGMDGALVDESGFPRVDVDVYQVRTARNKIICLSNDCRQLTLEMEEKLHQFHALNRPQTNVNGK